MSSGEDLHVPGETPHLDEGFLRAAIKFAARRRNKQKLITMQKPDYEVMVRIHQPSTTGERKIIYDGPERDLEYDEADGGVLVRLGEAAAPELDKHPLRDGVVLGAFGLLLMGGSFYIRHKSKK